MATQGPLFPSSFNTTSLAPENANDWLNTTNLSADDGSEAQITAATYDAGDISFRLFTRGFGFSVPVGATIDGVVVEIERRCFAGAAADNRVQLTDDTGALIGSNKATATAWPGTAGIATYGSSSDVWGATLTPTIVNDAQFGVVVSVAASANNTDIGIDFIRVTVHYTLGATTTKVVAWIDED